MMARASGPFYFRKACELARKRLQKIKRAFAQQRHHSIFRTGAKGNCADEGNTKILKTIQIFTAKASFYFRTVSP
jgi:hypothetical protein